MSAGARRGAGRPRDAAGGAGAGAGATARSPRGRRVSCGAGSGRGCLCYRDNVGAPRKGVTPRSPRGSWVAVDSPLPPRQGLRFGGRGREPRKLLPGRSPGAAPGFVRDRGLGSRAPLPVGSGRPPLRSGPGPEGLPAALPQPRGEGWLSSRVAPSAPPHPPFLPGAPSLSPAGRSSPAGERRQAGWTRRRARARPDPSGRPGGRGAWRGSPAPLPRPSPCRSFGPSPPSGAGTAGRNGGKRESFYKGGITDPAGTKEFLFGQSSQRGCGLAAWRPAPPGSPGAGGGAPSCR